MVASAGIQCFDARDVTKSTIFGPPYNGTISGIKLIHINGSFRCTSLASDSYWGCFEPGVQNSFRTMFMRITDENTFTGITYYPTLNTPNISTHGADITAYCSRGCYINGYPGYYINGLNASQTANLTFTNTSYNVTSGDKFMLQYSNNCCDWYNHKASGGVCAEVVFLYASATTPAPTHEPTRDPTQDPTIGPTVNPTTTAPTKATASPTSAPTKATGSPTSDPTLNPSPEPIQLTSSTLDTTNDYQWQNGSLTSRSKSQTYAMLIKLLSYLLIFC